MRLLHRYLDFQGDLSDLIDASTTCANLLDWGWEPERLTARLVRYYVAEGLIDRPDRPGKLAFYGYRHVVQLLLARRLADAKLPLSRIAQFNEFSPTSAIEAMLARTVPTAAEFEIELMRANPQYAYQQSQPARNRHSRPDPLAPRLSLSKADLVDQLQKIEHQIRTCLDEIARNREALASTQQQIAEQLKTIENHQMALRRQLDQLINRKRSNPINSQDP